MSKKSKIKKGDMVRPVDMPARYKAPADQESWRRLLARYGQGPFRVDSAERVIQLRDADDNLCEAFGEEDLMVLCPGTPLGRFPKRS